MEILKKVGLFININTSHRKVIYFLIL